MSSQLFTKWFCTTVFLLISKSAIAQLPDCQHISQHGFDQKVCGNHDLKQLNIKVKETFLNAQLMSNAPLYLLKNSQQGWSDYIKQCKNIQCLEKQFKKRIEDLTFLTTMNQSLTQNYIRYKDSAMDQPMTQLQLHQLDKNRIKIEAVQYRNPNNSESNQIVYLRSYTSPDRLNHIADLENKCTYQVERNAHNLYFNSKEGKCQRFTGLYKLYD